MPPQSPMARKRSRPPSVSLLLSPLHLSSAEQMLRPRRRRSRVEKDEQCILITDMNSVATLPSTSCSKHRSCLFEDSKNFEEGGQRDGVMLGIAKNSSFRLFPSHLHLEPASSSKIHR